MSSSTWCGMRRARAPTGTRFSSIWTCRGTRSACGWQTTSMQSVIEAPRRRDFLATNRGGGLYSEAVSQPIGSAIALVASRLGLPPTVLSLVNLVLGVGASATVVALAGRAAAGAVPAWLTGLIALLAWQLAYAF